MNETWIRRALYFAGAWNVLGGVSAITDPTRHFAQFYNGALSLDDPLQAFFFRATWINVIAWGIGYILAGLYPGGRVPVLLSGAAGKLVYFAASVALFSSGVGKTPLLVFGILDVVFAAFFVYVVSLQRRAKTQ